MIINAILLAFGLVGIPALICIHTEMTCGDHKDTRTGHKVTRTDSTFSGDCAISGAAA